jgi:hypothetical protein
VPVPEAHAIKALLQEKKSVHKIAIYKNQEHLFMKVLMGKDFQDARKRTLGFLATISKAKPPHRRCHNVKDRGFWQCEPG